MSNFYEPIKHKMSFFASCPLHLESLLKEEVDLLKVKSVNLVRGGVEFEAYNEKVIELILNSRFASRVFKKYYTFHIQNDKEFSSALRDIKWKAIFDVRLRFKVMTHIGGDVTSFNKAFHNTLYLNQLVKDAVVAHFKHEMNQRPPVDLKHPEVIIYLHITPENTTHGKKLKVDVLMDLCGDPLSDRGLRPHSKNITTSAPLRENLAAAIVKMTGWDPKTERFVDLMCGSGSVLAEAYMMAKNIPPSFKKVYLYTQTRDQIFAFQNLFWFLKDQYLLKNFDFLCDKVLEQSKAIHKNLPIFLKGMDIHGQSVQAAKALFQDLSKSGEVEIIQGDALKYSTDSKNMKEILFCNPPYGIRLESENEKLSELYYELGEQWKNHCKGARAFIFTANLPFLKRVSLKPSKKWDLFNGQLPAKLVEYSLY